MHKDSLATPVNYLGIIMPKFGQRKASRVEQKLLSKDTNLHYTVVKMHFQKLNKSYLQVQEFDSGVESCLS